VREREDENRTREAGHLDEIQGVVANTLNAFRNGAVGFIDWLGSGVQWIAIGLLLEFLLGMRMLKSVNASVSLDPKSEAIARRHIILSRVLRSVMPSPVRSNNLESARKLVAFHGH
jgi:hypothetical protein